jgi:glycosyltransferase involved in cell wall biosynthesis
MRVLLAADTALPSINGISVFVDKLGRYLSDCGHEVLLVVPTHANRTPSDGAYAEAVREVPALDLRMHDNSMALSFRPGAARRLIDELEPDVVHAHTPWFIGGGMLRAARELDVPAVYTHHVRPDNFRPYVPKPLRPPLEWYFGRKVRAACANADVVTCPSDSGAALLAALIGHRDVERVTNGIDLSDDLGSATASADVLSVLPAGEAPVVLYVGRLDRDKGMNTLIDVTRQVVGASQCQIVICGGGSEEGRVRRQLQPLVEAGRVVLTGVMPPSRVASLYRRASVVVMTGASETQPMVVLEAMAAGVPVVGFSSPGMVDVVRDGVSGFLLPPGQTHQFGRRVLEIVDDPALRTRLSTSARQLAEREHSIAASARAFLSLYAGARREQHATT